MKTQKTNCALYTRVSSRNQLDKDYSSLQTQRERLEAYCHSQGNFEIFRAYEDGAYSAENLERPALSEMLRDIQAGKVNCVLVYKIDRLTRSVKDFHLLMDLFDKMNVQFISITQSLDTQNPMGRLLRNILLDFAQFEREMTADRTRDKMHQRAQKGMWNGGGIPYGYRNEGKKLVPEPEEADRLKFMFEFYASNPSLSQLRTEVNRLGWRTRANQPWTKPVLKYMLSNKVYTGITDYNGQIHQGQHEPIVSEELFQKLQITTCKRQHARTKIDRAYLLKGLLVCSDCGSKMTPHYVQKRRKDGSINRIYYYRCTRTMKYNNQACKIKQLNADKAETFVIENLHGLVRNEEAVRESVAELNRDFANRLEPLQKQASEIASRIGQLESEISRFMDALGQGQIFVDRLEKEVAKRQGDIDHLRDQHHQIQQRINEEAAYEFNLEALQNSLRHFGSSFDGLLPDEKAEALQCMIKQINVLPEKLEVEIYELADFSGGSQNRNKWLQRLDSIFLPRFFGLI